jgi:hypothetical protein
MNLCTPALIYFILSIIGIIGMIFYSFLIIPILIQIIGVLLWTWLLNYLCSSGYEGVSWFLVLFPYIIIFIMVIFAGSLLRKLIKSAKDENKNRNEYNY